MNALTAPSLALPVRTPRLKPGLRFELAAICSLPAPGLDELSVLRELHDARVGISAVPVRDENIAVWSGEHVRGPVESVRAVPGNPGLAEREQDPSLRAELHDLVAFA